MYPSAGGVVEVVLGACFAAVVGGDVDGDAGHALDGVGIDEFAVGGAEHPHPVRCGVVVAGSFVEDPVPLGGFLLLDRLLRVPCDPVLPGPFDRHREVPRIRSRDLRQFRHGVGVGVELQQDRRLIQRQPALTDRVGGGGVLGDGEAGLDPVAFGAGALGDRGRGEAFQFEGTPGLDAVGVGERFALVVLDQLLHDPPRRVVIAGVDDVHGHGGDAGFAGGEGAALPGTDVHSPAGVPPRQQRREHPNLPDAVHEPCIHGCGCADVGLDDERVGVDVLDGAGGGGDDGHVLLPVVVCR
ncbi:hypothetical protein J2X03_000736 [Microbacterium trichothecenolyticum]|nr:hypothetical protein [Microbacterium trichothecenolyticum]MDR7110880.1 hypothetical protein [Microbacterium trichothecenolyticum]